MSADPTTEPPLGPERVRIIATVFYALLAAGGVAWIRLRTGSYELESLPGGRPGASVGAALVISAAVVFSSAVLMRRFGSMKWFALEIRALLGPIDTRTAAHLALVSGIAEELLFRGAMQPALGLVPTSLIFGAIHVGPDRRYLVWTGFAVIMGFVFGGLLLATGSILGPVVAHVLINFLNLRKIGAMELPAPAAPAPTDSPD